MIIQHNIMALNSYNRLGTNNNAVQKNLEKLSSGYRINRAGDDAAGLAISEKMRAQITGLERAQLNAKDGISLVQTAEGALTEVHSMLNRLVELGVESANGIYQATDRDKIQAEVDQITEEIDRISQATNFNGLQLLDGSLAETGAKGVGSVTVDLSGLTGTMLGGINTVDATKGTFSTKTALADVTGVVAADKGDKYVYSFEYTDNDGKHQKKDIEFELVQADGKDAFGKATGDMAFKAADGTEYIVNKTAAATIDKDQIMSAIVTELNKDADFSANFKVGDAGSGKFDFAAVQAGANGASLDKINYTVTKAANGNESKNAIDIDVGVLLSGVVGTTGGTADVSTAVDSFKTIDLEKAQAWDGSADSLEKSIFEINGQKFVFLNSTTTIDDNLKSQLSDAGVGNNFVQLAAANTTGTADAAATTAMAEKIGAATGLKVEQGTVTPGSTTTWAKNATGTQLALKDNIATPEKAEGGLTLQIGDTNDDFNKVTVYVDDMSSKGLGIDDLDVTDQGISGESIDRVKAAIEKVSVNRGRLGALQNRLEHTLNNLATTTENMTNAESRIRDTDMAQEMMAFTKNNVLVQAAQSMLAQANQQPQQVLQLLR